VLVGTVTMDRDQFVDVKSPGWWLLHPSLDPVLDQKRKTLGNCWGWTDVEWFARDENLGEVFRFLDVTRPELLGELDQLSDVYRRGDWLDRVIEAKTPAPTEPVEPAELYPPEKQPTSPAGVKPAPPTRAAAPAAPRKVSAFARRPTGDESASGQTGPGLAATETTAPARAIESRRPSPFGRKAMAAGEPVIRTSAGQSEPAMAPSGGAEEATRVDQDRTALFALAADPRVPVTHEQVSGLLTSVDKFNRFGGLPWANEPDEFASLSRDEAGARLVENAASPVAQTMVSAAAGPAAKTPAAPFSAPLDYGVTLCFAPLEAFTEKGMDHQKAYRLATHVFVEFDGTSAGFTRLPGENIVAAQVHIPDESSQNPEKRCIAAVPIDPAHAPTPVEAIAKLRAAARAGDRKGEYSVTSNNCETYARWLLRQAGLTAGSAPGGGGVGNKLFDLWQEFGSPWEVKDAGWLHRRLTGGNWGI
jgi:hypothetical protein